MTVTLTEPQQAVVNKVRALRAYTERTGMRTTRSERTILQTLNAEDLATVILALEN
jgi:hypothetical protein